MIPSKSLKVILRLIAIIYFILGNNCSQQLSLFLQKIVRNDYCEEKTVIDELCYDHFRWNIIAYFYRI